ncbi:PD-(D/E)XK nuclease family protein [Treponema ruminis]|uniref:PD-(D/E)XK endonuclease-like domain-containing protein n=1 Tax=Treponema ruminis TaxID=744515 RepID=A0A7W8GBE3_9SPIR|nr:PD-(D/E)XK nuclease family protein [Treponema ruminis]MBB5227181.1 hypothetical protein [Treponema ruminis]
MQSIQSLLQKEITNQDAVFVFPTDVACQKWADWVVKNTSVKAVAMERFLAWDKFKGECIRGKAQDLNTVPSLMRKIFAGTLIKKNAEKPFFKSIIVEKYAKEASAFTDWISSVLPSLKMWKNLREAQKSFKFEVSDDDSNLNSFYEEYKNQGFTDDEDRDFEILFDEYSKFLKQNHLFDPAWVEPDFTDDGREYFLIYPESLEDWEQYRHKLSAIEKIHFVSVPEEEGDYEAHFFENSSVEVKDVALFLREMHDKKGIEWSDMAVNVPNLDNYGSYLDREFSLYEIPRSLRYSRPLSSYGAGIFFSQLQDCIENQFSYESLKNLLLNEDLPWAQKSTIENLLLFGRMNNCICTAGEICYEKGLAVTVWDEAFLNPKDDRGSDINKDELIRNLYRNLSTLIPKMVRAESFEKIRSAYEEFKEIFFDMEEFQEMPLSNNVLSRCIISLNELVDLEKMYPDYKLPNPFAFFVSHLSKVQYLSQGEARAVQVYPYKSAPAAPYKVHVVLDSSQDSLSVAELFKPLSFMNENKRKIFMKLGEFDSSLGFSDSDPTFDFVKMYQHSATEKAYFTASRHAYNGEYGFAYGKLSKMGEAEGLSRKDIYAHEKKCLLDSCGQGSGAPLSKIFAKQATGFSEWKNFHHLDKKDSGLFQSDKDFSEMIYRRLHYRDENLPGHRQKNPLLLKRIEVTQTALKNYFKCPRKWLFKNVLKLDPLDNEAELIDEYIMGKVNHKIFENFFASLKEKRLLLCADSEGKGLGDEYLKLLVSAVNDAVDVKSQKSAFIEIFGSDYKTVSASQTTTKIISSQYAISDFGKARENPNFRMIERSVSHLCEIFSGYKVVAVEKEVAALPKDQNGLEEEGYYFEGKIDCILASSNESEFAIVDYKTSALPTGLYVKAQEEGKKENVIDFQMPMYIYLLENNVEEVERIKVSSAVFYSIKSTEEKPFLGQAPNGKENKHGQAEVELAISEFLKYAKRFYDEISDGKFAVNALNQSRALCAAKDKFNNCIDYQAICRRYFAVAGEEE